MNHIEDQEISWADLGFFREHEETGVPEDIRSIAQTLDEEHRFFEAERLVIIYQRIVGASRVILNLERAGHFSLVQLLDGTIAIQLGPTTSEVVKAMTEKLFIAALSSRLRAFSDEEPTYAEIHRCAGENIQRIRDAYKIARLTFQLIDECLPMSPCQGG